MIDIGLDFVAMELHAYPMGTDKLHDHPPPLSFLDGWLETFKIINGHKI